MIKVGSKSSVEQAILGEILAEAIERRTQFKVDRRLGLGDASIVHQAALAADVDIFAEDTVSATTTVLQETPVMDAILQYERVRNQYSRLYELTVSKPIGAGAKTTLVVPRRLAEKEHLSDLSSAAASKIKWMLGMTDEFATRQDGLANFSAHYHFSIFGDSRVMSSTRLFQALTERQFNLVTALESDGMLADPNIAILADDKQIFPPSQICVIQRLQALQEFHGLERVVDELTGRVQSKDLQRMGYEAIKANRSHRALASEFLDRIGVR